jgi:D-serine deaminase-like pyridoxal phosphate-dependent protein
MNREEYIRKPLEALTTPALVVAADALEHNLRLMAEYFASRPCKLRPHFKSHKCVSLAHRQLRAGSAVGITCAKLSEAEVLVAGGVKDVLIANQVVGPAKARRLAQLNRQASVRSAVDSSVNVAELGQAAQEAGVSIGVLAEVDIGMRRCGVQPGADTLALAKLVAETPGLRLGGLQGYEGHLVMIPDLAERRRRTLQAMQLLLAQRRALEEAGLACPIVSGGGTGTYDITGEIEGVDEVQAGSYALMDCHYIRLRPEFQNALSVLSTIISAAGARAVADVGLKGMGNDFGLPVVAGHAEAKVRYVAEEHTVIDGLASAIGRQIRLIPTHGCTTCNLHRQMWIIRNGIVEDVWPIEASGCLE